MPFILSEQEFTVLPTSKLNGVSLVVELCMLCGWGVKMLISTRTALHQCALLVLVERGRVIIEDISSRVPLGTGIVIMASGIQFMLIIKPHRIVHVLRCQWCVIISYIICEVRIMRYVNVWYMSLPLKIILLRIWSTVTLHILGGKCELTILCWHICTFIAFYLIHFLIYLWRDLPTVGFWFRKCHNIILFTHFFRISC